MKFLFATMILSTALFSNSQTALSLKNLTLLDALEKVKTSNLELAAAKYEIGLKKKAKWAAHSVRLGKLDVTQNIMRSDDAGNVFGFKLASREASFGDFGFSEFDGTNPNILNVQPEDLNYPGVRDYFQTKLTYELPIFVGGKLFAGASIASSMQSLAELDGKELELQKIYQVKKSFYDIALLESFLDNLRTVAKNIQTIESMTQTMISEGYAKNVDLFEVKSKKASITRLITQSEANHKLALHFLSFLLNESVESIDPKSIKAITKTANNIDINDLLMVKKAKEGLSISKSMVWMARGDYLPTVGAFAELSSSDDTFNKDLEPHQSYTVGLQVKWNVFDGFGTTLKVEQAKLARLKAQTQFELAKKGLALQISKLETEISSLDAEISGLNAEISFQKKIVENYRNRYAEKLSKITDVMMAESTYIQKILELKKITNEQNDKALQLQMITLGETK